MDRTDNAKRRTGKRGGKPAPRANSVKKSTGTSPSRTRTDAVLHKQSSGEKSGANSKKTNSAPPAQVSRKSYRRLEIVFHGIIAAATVVGLVVLISELGEFQKQTNLNRQALVSVQRAFVFPSIVPGSRIVDPPRETVFQVWVEWENSGSTPASNLKIRIDCIPSEKSLTRPQDHPAYGASSWSARILGPNATTYGGSCKIPESLLTATQKGRMHVYLLAVARYQDVFEESDWHITKYCAELRNITGNPSGSPLRVRVETHPCLSHNCYDQECERQK